MSVQDGLFIIRGKWPAGFSDIHDGYFKSPGMGLTAHRREAHRYKFKDAIAQMDKQSKLRGQSLRLIPVKE